jgi:hypothetical protein
MHLWNTKRYTELNTDADFEDEEVDLIFKEQLQNVYLKMKIRKATGIDGINAELVKYGGECLMERMLNILNKCWRKCKTLEEWRKQQLCHYLKKDEGLL